MLKANLPFACLFIFARHTPRDRSFLHYSIECQKSFLVHCYCKQDHVIQTKKKKKAQNISHVFLNDVPMPEFISKVIQESSSEKYRRYRVIRKVDGHFDSFKKQGLPTTTGCNLYGGTCIHMQRDGQAANEKTNIYFQPFFIKKKRIRQQ